jgi:cation transport protein ChaC
VPFHPTTAPIIGAPDIVRDPAPLLAEVVREWRVLTARHAIERDLWVFGYASLIWRPEFEAAEHRTAKVHGWHRALQMRSRINRGTPERPGLVFALLSGGSCQGMVYRIPHDRVEGELGRLWQREMPTGVYDPRWLQCHTPKGPVTALAFTLSRRSNAFVGRLEDPHLVQLLSHARGRYGTTLDYLLETARCLREHGIRDREIERLVAVARRAGLAA